MNELEHRLEQTLTARADTVVAGERLSGDAVVAAGRAARRRRRRGLVGAVTAGALAVVMGATVLVQTRSVGTVPESPGSAPAPSEFTAQPEPVFSPPGAPSVTSLGFDVAAEAGNLVIPADGAEFVVPLPRGQTLTGLVRVPSGRVLESYLDAQGDEAGFYLWFMPHGARLIDLGRLWGNTAVSSDGRRLVVAGGDDHMDVTAYELPSLRPIAQVRVEGSGPLVRGIAGDWVVLSDTAGDGSPTRAHTWNLRTGALRTTDADVNIWGVTDDGRVLRRVRQGERSGCVDLVAVTDLPTVRLTGLCSLSVALWSTAGGSLSPDGRWALLSTTADDGPVWIRVADLRAGEWRPVRSGLPEVGSISFWDTEQSVIFWADSWEYYRCRPAGSCVRLAVPLLAQGAIIGERRG